MAFASGNVTRMQKSDVSRSCKAVYLTGEVGAVPGLVGPTSKDVQPQKALLDCVHMPQQPLLPAMPEDAGPRPLEEGGMAVQWSACGQLEEDTGHQQAVNGLMELLCRTVTLQYTQDRRRGRHFY